MTERFELVSEYTPQGDQPRAIAELVEGIEAGQPEQTLLGVTGSGKSFTMACVVAALNRPALVMAPNKTLAAQLYSEFKSLFPGNAVEYFVSYYDYYQPEAYIPSSDTYIEKDSSINDEIDKLRHSATHSLLTRPDVLVVASVSCIYGLGSPEAYGSMHAFLEVGQRLDRDCLLRQLVDMLYSRNDHDFQRGTFRVRGDVVEVIPQYESERAVRIEFFGDEVEGLAEIDPLRGKVLARPKRAMIYPASHYVSTEERIRSACTGIRGELAERLTELRGAGKLLEAQRLEQRTMHDVESLSELGMCPGVENYSRWLDGRAAGEAPYTLYDYFPKDGLLFLDESHVTVPQIGAMYRGDRARKETLVEFGFRLPSALDNRPLRFEEWESRAPTRVYVSATPGDFELTRCRGVVVEQLIRPTGLVDPQIEVRPASGQVDDLLGEIRTRAAAGERVLVTTLTKRMAEQLTEYYGDHGVRVRYLHSDIQTIGRAARNLNGTVILYADKRTDSIERTLAETDRRRAQQERYNAEHGITPQSVKKRISSLRDSIWEADYVTVPKRAERAEPEVPAHELPRLIEDLRREMQQAAKALEYERAAELRDRLRVLEAERLSNS